MNSMSKTNYETSKKEGMHEKKRCNTFLKCGCPNSTTIQVQSSKHHHDKPKPLKVEHRERNHTLATLNLDTSCICDPKIKLDFTSNIIVTSEFTGSLTIQIFKQCKHQFTPVAIGPSWDFRVVDDTQSSTFSFFVCDSDSCEGDCCTYTAVATVISEVHGGHSGHADAGNGDAPEGKPEVKPAKSSTISINNATLVATVFCGENSCRKKCHY